LFPKPNLSRLTNGDALLHGIDGRSAVARRFRDVFAQIVIDLGGAEFVSEGQRQLAKRAAGLTVRCEWFEAAMARNEEVSDSDYVRLTNATARIFSALGNVLAGVVSLAANPIQSRRTVHLRIA